MDAKEIYLNKMTEVMRRLQACSSYIDKFKLDKSIISLESAILQLRKTMECMALSAIAPNHQAYSDYRSKADRNPDYRKDFNGTKIIKALRAINKDFYPNALKPPTRTGKEWHFERKSKGILTSKNFEALYDRLGKFLHADNPWGCKKEINNLAKDIPNRIAEIEELLKVHFTTIRTPSFNGVWVVEVPFYKSTPKILVGTADGDFIVND